MQEEMKFSGVVLDIYDDGGETLKEVYPSLSRVPDVIKHAEFIGRDELATSDFALVVMDEGVAHPRYPIYNNGVTKISELYFQRHGDKLPESAQKVAAHFITNAVMSYGSLPSATLTKVAGFGSLSSNVVDVSGQKPAPVFVKEAEEHWGVQYNGKNYFPLTTIAQVQQANEYWVEKQAHMPVGVRRSFAVNIQQRATELGVETAEQVKEAASNDYGPDVQLDNALVDRMSALPHEHRAQPVLAKLAGMRGELSPEKYAYLLAKFDEDNGLSYSWGEGIPDPFQSTYGIAKRANVIWESGPDRLTEEALLLLSTEYAGDFDELFSDNIMSDFNKDPVGTFRKLPTRLKRIVARLGEDMRFSGKTEGQSLWHDGI